MKTLFVTGVVTLLASNAFAQTSTVERDLATPIGHEVSAGLTSYTYREPGDQAISIHGAKFLGEYAGTFSLNKTQHWFAQAQLRGLFGSTTYNGWCSPFVIVPDNESPNGYALDTGDASPCNESGDKDWYAEVRGLVGKDLIGQAWGWSPYSGLGVRHLSNGINGSPGYRTDNYLYVPVGLTAHTAAPHALSLNVEFDWLVHGWQQTRDSDLGGGDIPATDTTPPFSVDGFTNISFSQPRGWAVRASAKFPMTTHVSLEPYYVRWEVNASPVNYETATFTVNGITAQQQLGAYEPFNTTNEFGVRFGFRF